MVWNSQGSVRKYCATRLSVRSLACSAAVTHSRSRARGKVGYLMSKSQAVFTSVEAALMANGHDFL